MKFLCLYSPAGMYNKYINPVLIMALSSTMQYEQRPETKITWFVFPN